MEEKEDQGRAPFVPLWRQNEAKALKSGTRGTIYWVKQSAKYDEFKRDGLLVMSKEPPRFQTGDSYAGDWLHNRKHGFGTMTWANGKKYQGDFRNGKRDGTGTLWLMKDGNLRKVYSGYWKEGRRHGVGVHFDQEGNKYEGSWFAGKKCGHGKLLYTNGDVYEGEFRENERSGLGILTYTNGDRFEGHWSRDKKEGPGRYYYRETRKLLQAEWIDDSPKAGVFSDWPGVDSSNSGEMVFELPEIHLIDSQKVLEEAFQETRRKRSEELGKRTANEAKRSDLAEQEQEPVFTEEELNDIATAFYAVDEERTGQVLGAQIARVLNELGIEPNEEDMEQLLEDLGATPESSVTLQAFVGLLASLRAPEDSENEDEDENENEDEDSDCESKHK